MTPTRILIYGNSRSGKTTMARATATELGLPHLDLDSITWASHAVRRPLEETLERLFEYVRVQPSWVIEGCYADVVEAAVPWCTELRFLNPGVEACIENCRRRPWEPSKYATREEQDRGLTMLVEWVRQYETRDDEYGLPRHRAIFDAFQGPKREYR
jgi:adenylate kinase family enzyme